MFLFHLGQVDSTDLLESLIPNGMVLLHNKEISSDLSNDLGNIGLYGFPKHYYGVRIVLFAIIRKISTPLYKLISGKMV